MIPDPPRRANMRHVTTTGSALAAALLPLVVGMLLAKTMAGDPLAPVNALITSGGQRARVSPSQWRSCGRTTLSRWKAERTEGLHRSYDGRARRCIGRLRAE